MPHSLAKPASFNLAVANISARAVLNSAQQLHRCLRPGGKLIASGFLQEQVPEFLTGIEGSGLALVARHQLDDWAAAPVRSTRPRATSGRPGLSIWRTFSPLASLPR